MRAPKRRREQVRKRCTVDQSVDLAEVAGGARYVGSPEHKDTPSFAGRPRPRADATICDSQFADMQEELTEWIRTNIRAGNVGEPWEGRFPRYVWCSRNGEVYEGRLINRGNGDYKGYKLAPDEWPEGIQ